MPRLSLPDSHKLWACYSPCAAASTHTHTQMKWVVMQSSPGKLTQLDAAKGINWGAHAGFGGGLLAQERGGVMPATRLPQHSTAQKVEPTQHSQNLVRAPRAQSHTSTVHSRYKQVKYGTCGVHAQQ
jgi:hypothetical protein